MTIFEKIGESSSEQLTFDELNEVVEMYATQHLEYLKSRGIDMDASDPAKAQKWMDYMNSYNATSRKGAELNPLIARADLKKYEEEKTQK